MLYHCLPGLHCFSAKLAFYVIGFLYKCHTVFLLLLLKDKLSHIKNFKSSFEQKLNWAAPVRKWLGAL